MALTKFLFSPVLMSVFLLSTNHPASGAPSDGAPRAPAAAFESQHETGPASAHRESQSRVAVRSRQDGDPATKNGRSDELRLRTETNRKVEALLRRLERVRREDREAARQALLSHPATRELLLDLGDEKADATRDPSRCFRAPYAGCLLAEAAETAKAIEKEDLRDWALGELLVVQARAGYAEAALATTQRIVDPRLVIVALRDIAKAQADAGWYEDALAAAEIIPDQVKQAEAILAVIEAQAFRGDQHLLGDTLERLKPSLEQVTHPVKRVALRCRLAVAIARGGDRDDALQRIEQAKAMAMAAPSETATAAGLRHVAAALAEMGQPEAALTMLAGIASNGTDRSSFLAAAAKAHAEAGNNHRALATAKDIEADRYRAVVLSRVAIAQTIQGASLAAGATVDRALKAAEEISLPFARDFAVSRVSLALAVIARHGAGASSFDRSVAIAKTIADPGLRAYTLWTVAAEQRRGAFHGASQATEELARQATISVKSPLDRAWMFGDLANERVAAGETGQAWRAFVAGVRVAADIQDPWARTRALGRLAGAYIDITGATTRSP